MPKNPYFDDEDEDYQQDDMVDSPETYAVNAQSPEDYPAWAQITSDLAEEPPSGFENIVETNSIAEQVVHNPIMRPSRPVSSGSELDSVPVPIPIPTTPAAAEPTVDTNLLEGVPVPISAPIEPKKTQTKPKMMPRERVEPSPEVPKSSRYVDEREEEPRRRKPLRETEKYSSTRLDNDDVDEDIFSALDDEEYEEEERKYSPPSSRKSKPVGRRRTQTKYEDEYFEADDLDEDEDEKNSRSKNKGGGIFGAWKKDSSKTQSSKKKKSSEKEGSNNNKYAGGRGRTLILRGIVWVTIGLVIFLGVRQVFFPPTPSIPVVAEQVAEELGITDFPEVLGGSLAVEFATSYLNYDPKNKESLSEREKQLFSYLPSNIEKDDFSVKSFFIFEGTQKQVIVDGPFLAERPTISGNRGFFIVAATIANVKETVEEETITEELVNEKRIYLTVPIVKDELGRVAVGGAPGFTPGQARAGTGDPLTFIASNEATASFAKEIPNLFTAWAKSDKAGLGRYLDANANDIAKTGLNNTVVYQGYENLSVEEVEDPFGLRYAKVDIVWEMNGNIFKQQYLLVVYESLRGEETLWFVDFIRPGLASFP
jgi:hypothetical protein